MCGSRLGEGRKFEIHNDVSGCAFGIDMGVEVDEQSRVWAKKYIENIVNKKYEGARYLQDYKGKKVKFGFSDIKKGLLYFNELLFGGILEPTRGSVFKPFVMKYKSWQMTRRVPGALGYHNLDEVINSTKKKMLFPMHITPEAGTLTVAPKYSNMFATIKMISNNLPEDYILVVKEHPSVASSVRTCNEVEKIKSLPNVLFIESTVSNYELFDLCVGIITVNSTMGLEAMLLGVPVVTLGKAFYDITQNVIKCDKIENLSKYLSKLNELKFNMNNNIQFYASYYEAVGKGYVANTELLPENLKMEALNSKNISMIAKEIDRIVLKNFNKLVCEIENKKIDNGLDE